MAGKTIENLLAFAINNGLIYKEDVPFCRNALIGMLGLSKPGDGFSLFAPEETVRQRTALQYLASLCDFAAGAGIIGDSQKERENFSARIMGAVTLPPSSVLRIFNGIKDLKGIEKATDWFYEYCRKCNYIQVDAIEKNVKFPCATKYGEFEITINLSKPELDPKSIAAAAKMSQSDYPACLICVENTGYMGDARRPARQNHRLLPMTLGGESWHFQYSPYLYYDEHCIALCDEHLPMAINKATFEKLFDFTDCFPHYFIGSNADLPIVGGSIMNHIHFQGGNYVFPMDKAQDEELLDLCGDFSGVSASLVRWPMTCIRLKSEDRGALIELGAKILDFWQGYSDESVSIIARTDVQHSTITPILRKDGGGYIFHLILRNNRTDEAHPDGIFHQNKTIHHIKKENLGLIEDMGLFILPGRLKNELETVEKILRGELSPEKCPEAHAPWCEYLLEKYSKADICESGTDKIIREELTEKCVLALEDAGVFKCDEKGREAFRKFWENFVRTLP